MVRNSTTPPKKKTPKPLIDDYHLLSYDTLDSTNAEARRLAEGGGAHGAFLWAKQQTQGRGRYGREWVSEEGNLFVSILLAPEEPLAQIPQLSFVASLAAAESVKPLLPDAKKLTLKWPNDVLLGGKKLGGILLESFETQEETGKKRWVIIGLGLNVDHAPTETIFPATYLKAAGVEIVSAKIVLSRFIHHFIEKYGQWQAEGFAPIRKQWLKLAEGMGQPATVRLPDEQIQGVFQGMDAEGNLTLLLDSGKKRKIAAGEVFFAPEPPQSS